MDGVPIAESAMAMWTERLRPLILERKATFFEATTAIAFADFAARGAEIVVVEVGLGGRLDSTNVLRPLVSAVTKIERDHMKYLGDTLELIAAEKAGIAKPGVPFVVGERDPALVQVLRREARKAVARGRPDGRADVRVLPPEYEWTGPARSRGPAPAAECRRGLRDPDGPARALPARSRRRGAASRPRLDAGAARPAGQVAVRRRPQPRRHSGAGEGDRRSARPGRSTRWSRSWATRSGPRCWCELDRIVDRGILTVAPTAASRGWNAAWLRRWLRDRGRPPARAAWTLVPDFGEALETGAGGGRNRCW